MGGWKVWRRLGVVATFLWILGAGYTQFRVDTDRAAEGVQNRFQACSVAAENRQTDNLASCLAAARAARGTAERGLWTDVPLIALAPPLVAWVLVYLTIFVLRWVWAGRSRS